MTVSEFFFGLQCICLVAQIVCGVMMVRTESERWAFPAIFLGPVNVLLCGLVMGTRA